MGQRHRFRAQTDHFLPVQPVGIEEKAHRNRRSNGTGGLETVPLFLHGAKGAPGHRIQHQGIHTPAEAQILFPGNPAVVPIIGVPAVSLILGPFQFRQRHIAHIGCHHAPHLSPGHTHQQTVAGIGGNLGIGGDIGIAVHQIIAQQSAGAVIIPDLFHGLVADGITQCISRSQAQQTSLVCLQTISHAVFLHSMLILLYYNEYPEKRQGFLVSPPGIFPRTGKAVAFFTGKCYNIM